MEGAGHVGAATSVRRAPRRRYRGAMGDTRTPLIRRLGGGDAFRAAELNALFAVAFEDEGSYAARRPATAYLERVLADPGVLALVAEVDGEVVGGLVAYELRKLEQERSEVYLYDLAVAAAHRRRGVATALIRELCALARERGAWVVFVQADHGDDAAIALYTKLGAREDVLHFDIGV